MVARLKRFFRSNIDLSRRVFLVYSLLTLLAMIVAVVITFGYSRNLLTREVQQSNRRLVSRYRDTLEKYYLDRVNLILNEKLIVTYGANTLINFWKPYGNAEYLRYYTELRSLTLNCDFCESVFVYRYLGDISISSDRGLTVGLMDDDNKNVSARERNFVKYTTGISPLNTWLTPARNKTLFPDMQTNVLTRVVQIPLFAKEKTGLMAIHINADALLSQAAEEHDTARSSLFLMDDEGNIFAHTNREKLYDPAFATALPLEDIITSAGFYIDRSGSVQIAYTVEKIESVGWYLVSQTPLTAFEQANAALARTVTLVVLVCGLFALFFVRLASKRVSRPWLAVYEVVRAKMQIAPGVTDVESIRQFVHSVPSDLSTMREVVERTQSSMPMSLMVDLLYNKTMTEEVFEKACRILGKHFEKDRLHIVLIDIDKAVLEPLDMMERAILVGEAETAVASLFPDHEFTVSLSYGNIVSLFSMEPPYEFTEVSGRIHQTISDILGLRFNLIVSEAFQEITDAAVIFSTLSEGARYHFLYGYGNTFTQNELKTWDNNHMEINPDALDCFRRDLIRDPRKACAFVRESISVMLEAGGSYNALQTALLTLTQTVSRRAKDNGMTTQDFTTDSMDIFAQISYVTGYVDWLEHVIMEYHDFMKRRSNSVDHAYIERIAEYIDANIEGDVSQEHIAEHFNLSVSHLSRIYKEYLGVSFSDYVIDCKLTRAAHKLLTTNESIGSIISDLGYQTLSYFSRIFKAKYGQTPSQYRKASYRKNTLQ